MGKDVKIYPNLLYRDIDRLYVKPKGNQSSKEYYKNIKRGITNYIAPLILSFIIIFFLSASPFTGYFTTWSFTPPEEMTFFWIFPLIYIREVFTIAIIINIIGYFIIKNLDPEKRVKYNSIVKMLVYFPAGYYAYLVLAMFAWLIIFSLS